MNTFENALSTIVKKYGISILSDPKVVNILLDYNAFSDFPAAKQILRAIIDDGTAKKIIKVVESHSLYNTIPNADEVRLQFAALSSSFSRNNGFKEDLINYVFNGILVSVGVSNQHDDNNSAIEKNATDNMVPDNTQFLVVKVSPQNSTLYVDGVVRVTTNGVWVGELCVGKHEYRVEQYPLHEEGAVYLNISSRAEIDINLFSSSSSMFAVSVSVEEDDTEIFIDGVNVGRGLWNGQLSQGEHIFLAKNPKFYTSEKNQLISSNQDIIFSPLKPKTGNLSVNVSPVGSIIYINGREMGKTPIVLRNLPIGQMILVVKTEEGSELKSVIEIKEKHTTSVVDSIDTLFFDDYSKARIGDFFYEDGTLSHIQAKNKVCIGIVFSTKPHLSDVRKGWSHGCLISIDNDNVSQFVREWGDLSVPLSPQFPRDRHTDIQNYVRFGMPQTSLSGYERCADDLMKDNPLYCAIFQAGLMKQITPLPKGKTSGWYLPTIQQLIELCENIYKAGADNFNGYGEVIASLHRSSIEEYTSQRDLIGLDSRRRIWSSSIDSHGIPLMFVCSGNYHIAFDSGFGGYVVPVASF